MPAPPEESDPAIVRATGVWAASSMLTTRSLLRRGALHDLSAEILGGHCLLDTAQRREIVEQPAAEPVDRAGEEQQPGDDQQRAHRLLQLAEVAAEALHEAEERPYGDRCENEWNAEAQRVDEQELHAGRQAALVGGERQHGRQDRPDARRPPEGTCKAYELRASVDH